jgi:diguanylate cyclase (GGDEF)-like protein
MTTTPMLLVDENRNIELSNRAADELFCALEENSTTIGSYIGCSNSINNICGFSSKCYFCSFNDSYIKALSGVDIKEKKIDIISHRLNENFKNKIIADLTNIDGKVLITIKENLKEKEFTSNNLDFSNHYLKFLNEVTLGFGLHEIKKIGLDYQINLIDFNETYEEILTVFDPNIFIGKEIYQLLKNINSNIFLLLEQNDNESSMFSFEYNDSENNKFYDVKIYFPIKDHFVLVFNNISQYKLINMELENRIHEDSLTKVGNRRAFDSDLKRVIQIYGRLKKPVSLIMLDIDYYKQYNDTYGHQKGDECLLDIASILKESIKRVDDGVYRYGGEEFSIILPNTGIDGALNVVSQIFNKVSNKSIPHESSIISNHITLSAGIASLIPDGVQSSVEIIKMADQSLFRAKNEGRNTFRIFGEK